MKDLLVSLTFYPLPIGGSFGGFLEPHLPRPPLRPNYMYFIFMGIFKKNEENQQIEMEQHMDPAFQKSWTHPNFLNSSNKFKGTQVLV